MNSGQFERQVAQALVAIAARRLSGMADLYDLLGDSVYSISLSFTGDTAQAEAATVKTLVQIWQFPARHPDHWTARWVLELAGKNASEQSWSSTRPARLHAVAP